MSTGETSRERSSVTTSSGGRQNTKAEREADLLAHEAAAAQAAALGAIQDLKTGLATAADPRLWAEQHPWAAVGIAAAAGFAAAALVMPSPEQKLKDKLSDLVRGIQPSVNGNGKPSEHPSPAGPLAGVMEALMGLGKTAIVNFVVAAVHKASEGPSEAPSNEFPSESEPAPGEPDAVVY
ncbi:MAG: hypothetical protein HY000_01830 [Planctomycetes bacterium]|nr:hypothetical protein [Planctomycetota bacterium]